MKLIEDIKINEGFEGMPYKDSLGFDTIGYGTKLPLDKEESELLLKHRLNKFINEVNVSFPKLEAEPEIWDMLYEMSYQMGTRKLLGFKKMIKALHEKDYKTAYKEGKDSLWYKQTPNRALRVLSVLLKNIN